MSNQRCTTRELYLQVDQSMSIEKEFGKLNNDVLKKTEYEFKDAERLKSTGLFFFAEAIIEGLFGCLPVVGKLIKHNPPPLPRPYFQNIYVLKPGIWSIRTVYDSLMFRWIKYMAEEEEAEDESAASAILATFQSAQQNIALISALLLTVWAGFFSEILSGHDDAKEIWAFYLALLLFAYATITSMWGTIVPVFMCIATNQIKSPVEAVYYLRLLDHVTYGFGSQSGLLFLNGSCTSAFFGMFFYAYMYSGVGGAFTVFAMMSIGLFMFAQFYFQMVSCLYTSTKSFSRKDKRAKDTSLTFGELNKCLRAYMMYHGAVNAEDMSADCTAETFISFIENQYPKEPISLTLVTTKRAKQLYNTFLERNLFDKVLPQNFELRTRNDFLKPSK